MSVSLPFVLNQKSHPSLGLCYIFCTYTSPVADIIKRHNLTYHRYADDTQLYVSFKLGSYDLLSSAKSSIEICVEEINNWMILNGLELNEEKTELLLLSSRYRPSPSLEFVRAGGELFNRPLLFVILEWYSIPVLIWKTTLKRCTRHLTNISKIRTYLDRESTEAIIQCFCDYQLRLL